MNKQGTEKKKQILMFWHKPKPDSNNMQIIIKNRFLYFKVNFDRMCYKNVYSNKLIVKRCV